MPHPSIFPPRDLLSNEEQDDSNREHLKAIKAEGFFFAQTETDAVGDLEDDHADRIMVDGNPWESEDMSEWISEFSLFCDGFDDYL
jgi:hypothetical protein